MTKFLKKVAIVMILSTTPRTMMTILETTENSKQVEAKTKKTNRKNLMVEQNEQSPQEIAESTVNQILAKNNLSKSNLGYMQWQELNEIINEAVKKSTETDAYGQTEIARYVRDSMANIDLQNQLDYEDNFPKPDRKPKKRATMSRFTILDENPTASQIKTRREIALDAADQVLATQYLTRADLTDLQKIELRKIIAQAIRLDKDTSVAEYVIKNIANIEKTPKQVALTTAQTLLKRNGHDELLNLDTNQEDELNKYINNAATMTNNQAYQYIETKMKKMGLILQNQDYTIAD